MSRQQAELIAAEGKRWPHSGYHVKIVAVKLMRIKMLTNLWWSQAFFGQFKDLLLHIIWR